MEKISTKDKIIIESLRLFSEKGYSGVSMREIATAVGIKGSSLYNHFKGKEAIFIAIFDDMKTRYDYVASLNYIPKQPNKHATDIFFNIKEEELMSIAESLFTFFTQDEIASMSRKLLISEQHKSKLAADCFKSFYLEMPLQFQRQLFYNLQQLGEFKGFDADTMALHFYSPIFLVLNQFDLGYSCHDCIEILKKHIHQFCIIYHNN